MKISPAARCLGYSPTKSDYPEFYPEVPNSVVDIIMNSYDGVNIFIHPEPDGTIQLNEKEMRRIKHFNTSNEEKVDDAYRLIIIKHIAELFPKLQIEGHTAILKTAPASQLFTAGNAKLRALENNETQEPENDARKWCCVVQ